MAVVSQKTKYVKLDDGVSFALVRTNPKLTTNTKLMYNGKKLYMESYPSSPLLNRTSFKNVSVKSNSTYNKDIANFLLGSGAQAYSVYQNFSDVTISNSYDNQFETMYWCGAEYIDSNFYTEEIGFVAPLYIREKLPNYFLIFRLDTPSNYNLNVDENGDKLDPIFDFKSDILDKAVLIKTFDLREGSPLGNYIHNYIDQDGFEFDKSMYVNFSNSEVTYYGINRRSGILEKKVENFENELLNHDKPITKDDKWFTEGFERNNLIFPYIMNIEYLFDDENFKHDNVENVDFARYIGLYCNNIEFGEFADLNELKGYEYTQGDAIYYFEDNKRILHRYVNDESGLKIDGKDSDEFDKELISGFEKERITGYAEPLDIYEGFINRAQYGFEILKTWVKGDWIAMEYDGHVEYYFADENNTYVNSKENTNGDYSYFKFHVDENSSPNDIAESLSECINRNKKSKFEAKYADNFVVIYAKREELEYNNSRMLVEATLLYEGKISLPVSKRVEYISDDNYNSDMNIIEPVYGDYYIDYFSGACDVEIDENTETYKNIFKIYTEEYVFFDLDRYLKTNNGKGRKISTNMIHINAEGIIDPEYRIVIVENAPDDKKGDYGYDVSVSSTYQVEIMDPFKPNHGVFSWFPVKDFDFDVNYSSYGQYGAFIDECNTLSKKVTYTQIFNRVDTADSDSTSTQEDATSGLKDLAKSPFFDDYGNSLETEYDYYFEQILPELCLVSKSVPYITKWGYYDGQKDSCENPYRLNINKIFGISNLSANTYLRDCDVNEYTHSMPYYMTMDTPDYNKEYQYIASNETYVEMNSVKQTEQNVSVVKDDYTQTFFDCVNYWIDIFMETDEDMFSYFFSGKKYGKRFDKKYSRLLGGDKFHNPSTLFRGVKFEVVRQYNGVDKRSSEYNDYKFSFVYIPVMLNSMLFNSTVYFVKNDTFKFIVGIIFVNTMLGAYEHNIFNGKIDYFNKGFLYAASEDIIRPENRNKYDYTLEITYNEDEYDNIIIEKSKKSEEFWDKWFDISKDENVFYIWKTTDEDTDVKNRVIVTKNNDYSKIQDINGDVIGEYVDIVNNYDVTESNRYDIGIEDISRSDNTYRVESVDNDNNSMILISGEYYKDFDIDVYRRIEFKKLGYVRCIMNAPNIEFKNNIFTDICDNIKWSLDEETEMINVDVSEIYFKSESLRNILNNMATIDSVVKVVFNYDNGDGERFSKTFEHNKDDINITVDIESSVITIENMGDKEFKNPVLSSIGVKDGEAFIENIKVDIYIKDYFDANMESLGLKNYFSVFEQISAFNITESINNDYNVKYYSTVEDNKYKIRVIEPDSIEIEDRYESIPVKVTNNSKSVVGSVEIKEKSNVDKIGIKTINRYSGFYNPIFNDILFFGDYNYSKIIGRLKNEEIFELPYSNTNIDYNYSDAYGDFGVIKNMYYHKTNTSRSDRILTFEKPLYPAINEYALDYRDYNIFSSSWDEGYFITQDDLDNRSICDGIGSMKDSLCMFGSKYLNLPDRIFVDTFENGKLWDEKMSVDVRDNTDTEIMFKEINGRTVRYHLFLEKRLKRYLKGILINVFSKYINKEYSFGNKGTIEDDVEEYVEKNLLRLYKVDKVYLYIKDERMRINDKIINNEYLEFLDKGNEIRIESGFPVVEINGGKAMKDSRYGMSKVNEFDRIVT